MSLPFSARLVPAIEGLVVFAGSRGTHFYFQGHRGLFLRHGDDVAVWTLKVEHGKKFPLW